MVELPPLVWTEILEYAIAPEDREYGGTINPWSSNEWVHPYSTISRNCEIAHQDLLYRSVILLDVETANLFLRTIRSNPTVAEKVSYLVLAGDTDEASATLVEILGLCTHVRHLHVNTLHSSIRDRLIAQLQKLPLRTLIVQPRLHSSIDLEWILPTDTNAIFPPSLTTLELDFWGNQQTDSNYSQNPLGVISSQLRHVRIHTVQANALVHSVLESASMLETCDLYFERCLDPNRMANSLKPSLSTLRNMRFIVNPTSEELHNFDESITPTFDRILPDFQQLKRLLVSSTDISTQFLRLLPPSLQDCSIQSYNHRGTFHYSPDLLDDLHDPRIFIPLREWAVHDLAEAWEGDDVNSVSVACQERGIRFRFYADSAGEFGEEGSSGDSSMNG